MAAPPQPPYAKLLVSVNNGAWQSGGVSVSVGDTLTFRVENTNGVETQIFRIRDFPDGMTQPSGWSTAAGMYYYNTDLEPPAVTVTHWGKLMTSVTLNGGLRNGVSDSTLWDEQTAIATPSKATLKDIGEWEADQFARSWIHPAKDNLRIVDNQARPNVDPRTVSGCRLFWTADAQSPHGTRIQSALFSNIPNLGTNGGNLWDDNLLIVLGDFASTGAARPPISKTANGNWNRAASFDGAADYQASGLAASEWKFLHDKGTYVLVFRPTAAANGNVLTTCDAPGVAKVGFAAHYEAAQNIRFTIMDGSGVWRFNWATAAASLPINTDHIVIFRYDVDNTPTTDVRINGAIAVGVPAITAAASAANPVGTAHIGAMVGPAANYFTGLIWVQAAFDEYLTDGETQDIENALRTRYGI